MGGERDEEPGAGRLGDYVLADFADGAAVGGDVRGGECVGVVAGAAASEPDSGERSGCCAGLDDWSEPAADGGAESVFESGGVCVSGTFHGGDDGAEYADGAGDCVGAGIVVEDVGGEGAAAVYGSLGL